MTIYFRFFSIFFLSIISIFTAMMTVNATELSAIEIPTLKQNNIQENNMMTPLILEPKTTADSAIIWLHGLGATKNDFEPVAQILQEQALPSTRFILPQAPIQPVTLNNGMAMPSWYDIISLTFPRDISIDELNASSQLVIDLIEAEITKGISLDRIFLAGFSQGGAVVLHTAYLRYDKNIGGVLALSTYAPTFVDNVKIDKAKKNIPSAHFHGSADNVVNMKFGKEAEEFLKAQGATTEWNEYPMMHEVSNEEIQDIAIWLLNQLKK